MAFQDVLTKHFEYKKIEPRDNTLKTAFITPPPSCREGVNTLVGVQIHDYLFVCA